MNFLVLNGSPKREKSITLQSMRYLENQNRDHNFKVINISDFSTTRDRLREICEEVKKSDGIIWSFPIYCGHLPSNLRLFIELIFDNNMQSYFNNKYTTAFSTSIHYYDHTAHNYIHGICDDLQMNYINSLSHESSDLLKEETRDQLNNFFKIFIDCINSGIKMNKYYKEIKKSNFVYTPTLTLNPVKTEKKTFIITDVKDEDKNLNNMIKKFRSSIDGSITELNLNKIDIKGSCTGCCRCGYDNTCIYRDDFKGFYDNIIDEADIIVFAFNMKDRFLSSKYSLFMNRGFVYNHVPVFKGKQIGYLISGGISGDFNTRQLLDEAGTVFGITSDESEENLIVDREIEDFVKIGVKLSHLNYFKKDNFLGVAGKKLFADEIGNSLSAIFLADYKYFKKNNYFPKKGINNLIEKIKACIFRLLMSQERVRGEIHKNMFDHMVASHKKLIESGVR